MHSSLIQTYRQAIQEKRGFAMLFTVLIITLILSLAIGISDTTYKQTLLSGLARDSQVAFYQADAAIECGMEYDTGTLAASFQRDAATPPASLDCGNLTLQEDLSTSHTNYYEYSTPTLANTDIPCMHIIFDKTQQDAQGNNISVVKGRGFNTCVSGPRQVERALQVTY